MIISDKIGKYGFAIALSLDYLHDDTFLQSSKEFIN